MLRVNEASLDGLTHSQAVATLKATISLSSVTLVIMEVSVDSSNMRYEQYESQNLCILKCALKGYSKSKQGLYCTWISKTLGLGLYLVKT